MNHSVNFSDAGAMALGAEDRGERVRYLDAVGVFEDMHRTLKARAAATPERQALDGLDAVLSLVAPHGRHVSHHLDTGAFSAFRGSIELLHDHTPEARALELFEGAVKALMAAAPDFDDLPDAHGTAETETSADPEPAPDEQDEDGDTGEGDEEGDEDADDGDDAADAEKPAAHHHAASADGLHHDHHEAHANGADDHHAAHEGHDAGHPAAGAEPELADGDLDDGAEPAPHATLDHAADDDLEAPAARDLDDGAVQRRIAELEAELATARERLAA